MTVYLLLPGSMSECRCGFFFRSGYNFLVVKCEDGRSDQRWFSRKTEVYSGAGCYLMVEETRCDTGV